MRCKYQLQVFSKPFVGAMDGHSDGLYCLARNPRTLNSLLSGAADGEIRLWDLPSQRTLRRLLGHTRAGAHSLHPSYFLLLIFVVFSLVFST